MCERCLHTGTTTRLNGHMGIWGAELQSGTIFSQCMGAHAACTGMWPIKANDLKIVTIRPLYRDPMPSISAPVFIQSVRIARCKLKISQMHCPCTLKSPPALRHGDCLLPTRVEASPAIVDQTCLRTIPRGTSKCGACFAGH